jgi:hypothetical protein
MKKTKKTTTSRIKKTAKKSVKINYELVNVWKWLLISLSVIILIGGMTSLIKNNNSSNSAKSYFSNSNNIICDVNEASLICEDLSSGDVVELSLPSQYKNTIGVNVSPDSQKLIVHKANGDVDVTDSDFNKIRTIFETKSSGVDGIETYTWSSDSSNIIISKIYREPVDADFLPKPFVVTMLNVDTGDTRGVYKAGENVDVEQIRILGVNDEYLFASVPSPKNWVADSTDLPPVTVYAIALNDGSVQTVNTSQLKADNAILIAGDVFLVSEPIIDENYQGRILATKVVMDERGISLIEVSRRINTSSVEYLNEVLVTSKGINVFFANESEVIQLLDNDGTITDTQLKKGKYGNELISLGFLPNLTSVVN